MMAEALPVDEKQAHFGLLFAAMVHMVVPVHRHVSVRIRRLRSPALRRVLAMVLGALGVLALSGSQALNPALALASGANPAATEQGSPTMVTPTDPLWPLPTPYPTSSLAALPSGA